MSATTDRLRAVVVTLSFAAAPASAQAQAFDIVEATIPGVHAAFK